MEEERREKTLNSNAEVGLGLAIIIRYLSKRIPSEKVIKSGDIKCIRCEKPYLDDIY